MSTKNVIKVEIRSTSGFCSYEDAYEDKIVITKESIKYTYNPMFISDINPVKKWSFKTNNEVFNVLFDRISKDVIDIIYRELDYMCEDIGAITFIVTYDDKSKDKRDFFVPGDEFKECFANIRVMVPKCENVLPVLLTEDDYEDD